MTAYDFAALREQQALLASRVETADRLGEVRLIAATDISAGPYAPTVWASVVLFSYPGLEAAGAVTVRCEEPFPYRTGFLGFRETPPLLKAFERLGVRPDLVLADGHGLCHPRRFGLACQLGVTLELPTLGCAKRRLLGELAQPLPDRQGARAAIVDRGEVIGYAVRTRAGSNPVWVSTGHRISAETSARWVLELAGGYRLPLPLREAHNQANRARRGEAPSFEVEVERVAYSSE